MKKRLLILSLVMVCALSATAFAAAPDRVNKLDWGGYAAGAFNDKADDGGYFSTSLSYGLTPWIAVGIEGGYQGVGAATSDQDLGLVNLLGDIIVRVPNVHEQLVPYGVVGLGVTGAWIEDDDGIGANNGEDSDDTAFGWKIGGGLDWFVNPNWILNFEFAYFDSSVGLNDENNSSVGSNVGFWTIGGGIKYVF